MGLWEQNSGMITDFLTYIINGSGDRGMPVKKHCLFQQVRHYSTATDKAIGYWVLKHEEDTSCVVKKCIYVQTDGICKRDNEGERLKSPTNRAGLKLCKILFFNFGQDISFLVAEILIIVFTVTTFSLLQMKSRQQIFAHDSLIWFICLF